MLDKRFIEQFLRLNNVPLNAPESEIRTVLTEARWSTDDINAALIMLSGKNPEAEAQLKQKENERAFRPDLDWSSEKLSSLLGIDVIVDPQSVQAARMPVQHHIAEIGKKFLVAVTVAVVAVLFAGCVGAGVMYALEIGPFRAPVESIL